MSVDTVVGALRNAVAIDKDGINHIADLLEQLQAENERLKAEIDQLKVIEKDKKDCVHYINQEGGMCISPYRSSVICCGTRCGSFISTEDGRMRSE